MEMHQTHCYATVPSRYYSNATPDLTCHNIYTQSLKWSYYEIQHEGQTVKFIICNVLTSACLQF
jgi:hypothetical protein